MVLGSRSDYLERSGHGQCERGNDHARIDLDADYDAHNDSARSKRKRFEWASRGSVDSPFERYQSERAPADTKYLGNVARLSIEHNRSTGSMNLSTIGAEAWKNIWLLVIVILALGLWAPTRKAAIWLAVIAALIMIAAKMKAGG